MSSLTRRSQPLIAQLRKDLLQARKDRDSLVSEALQSVIAAIDNAGAVPTMKNVTTLGVGSTEAVRRELSAQDVQDIIKNEIVEMQQAIKEFGNVQSSPSRALTQKITILENYFREQA